MITSYRNKLVVSFLMHRNERLKEEEEEENNADPLILGIGTNVLKEKKKKKITKDVIFLYMVLVFPHLLYQHL